MSSAHAPVTEDEPEKPLSGRQDSAWDGDDFWNDPAIIRKRSRWMKFERPGDTCGPGTISAFGKKTFDAGTEDERTCPEVFFSEPDVPSVTAGPWSLLRGLTEVQPRVGDRLTVEFVSTVGKSKMFTITVVGPEGAQTVVDTRKYL